MCDPVAEDTGDPITGDVAAVEFPVSVNASCLVKRDLPVVHDVLPFGKGEVSGVQVGDGRVVDSFLFL